MHRWLWLLVVGCAHSKAPPEAPTPAVDVDVDVDVDARSTVSLRFRPEPGPVVHDRLDRSVIIASDGTVDGVNTSWTERITATRRGESFTMRVRRDDFSDEPIGQPNRDQRTGSAIRVRLLPSDLTFHVSSDAQFEDVDRDRTRAVLDEVRSAITDAAGTSEVGERIGDAIASFVTVDNIAGMASVDWQHGPGFFAGAVEIELGELYEIRGAQAIPMLGPDPVPFVTTFYLSGRVPCHPDAAEVRCVELIRTTAPDPKALAARLEAFVGALDEGAPAISQFERTEQARTIIDPTSLAIWRQIRDARVEATADGVPSTRRYLTADERRMDGRPSQRPSTSLPEARAAHTPEVLPSAPAGPPPEPAAPFELVRYDSPVGPLAAYVTADPGDGARHPAIVWLTGGDTNTVGDVWSPMPTDNDQSARAYREYGLAMMFPSQRGGNDNPGQREGFLGEVDDVLAATDHLASLPWVDPDRIYLGGHSSGATLALLVAASTDRYRAVFAFGPVSTPAYYGGSLVYADLTDPREYVLRSPRYWLHDITTPTWILEGTEGNIDDLRALQSWTGDAPIEFYEFPDADHFEMLGPFNEVIARAIAASPDGSVDLDEH